MSTLPFGRSVAVEYDLPVAIDPVAATLCCNFERLVRTVNQADSGRSSV